MRVRVLQCTINCDLACPFFCEADNKCIRESAKCDGRPQCSDGADEADCRKMLTVYSLYRSSLPYFLLEVSLATFSLLCLLAVIILFVACDGFRCADKGCVDINSLV
jgi:hypothetical protein